MTSSDPALDDPLFRELRRRHPDVDIALLPPQQTTPPPLPQAAEGACRAVQQHSRAVLASVAAQLGLEAGSRVDFWWQQRHPLVHRWASRTDFPRLGGHGVESLRTLGNILLDLGWDARPVGDDPPRLRAVAGSFELIATGRPDVLTVEVLSEPLHLTPDVLAALTGAGDGA